jgi:pilus assembly protein CpaD
MVDRLFEFIEPRAEMMPCTSRGNQVFENYGKGEGPETVYPDLDKAKISDLGK